MKKLLVALVTTILLASGCSSDGTDGPDGTVPGPGQPTIAVDTPEMVRAKADSGVEPCAPGTAAGALPAVTLPCLGGGTPVDLSTLTGPLVLNFWASSCGPCRTEMPLLQQLHEQAGDQVSVIGIDLLDTLPVKALTLAGERGATYPQLADTGGELLTTSQFAKVQALPYLAFVDAGGELVALHAGAVTSYAELTGLVRDNLGVDLSATAR